MANSIPTYTKIPIPFANSGDKNSIPQNATGSNLASYSEGFPPITSQPITENGIPPEREDFNGLGFSTTNNISYLQQGGLYTFDTQLSSAIGGYAQGAILAYINNGQLYYLRSKINNNTYNFNTNSSYIGQYWEYAFGQGNTGGFSIGSIFAYPSALPPEGAYLLNGQTITNCQTLYPDFWNWLTSQIGEYETVPVYKAWTMPALTADGTVGGAEYAVEASGAVLSGYEAYKSFDGTHGGAKTYAVLSGTKTGYLTYYSPKKLKLTRVLFQNSTASSGTYLPVSVVISGSNDNADWDELASVTYASTSASATQTEDIPESKYTVGTPGYQYLKFEFANGGAANTHIPEITLYCEEYLYTDYTGNGNILTMSNEAYDYTLSRTGVCGGFVINSIAGSVRLPTLINGTLWGADSSNIGQSLAAGLPNITANWKSEPSGDAHGAVSVVKEKGDIQAVSTGGEEDCRLSLDASRSNPIYGNSDTVQPPAIRVSWCIQVYNAATALSEQESAQLASQMQMKAQKDLGNVEKVPQITVNNIMPDAMDYVVESWNDGAGGWYRKYRSGWVEQGGVTRSIESNATLTVTLYIEMRDVEFSTIVTNGAGASVDDNWDYGAIGGYATSTTTILVDRARGKGKAYWRVAGMAAN